MYEWFLKKKTLNVKRDIYKIMLLYQLTTKKKTIIIQTRISVG